MDERPRARVNPALLSVARSAIKLERREDGFTATALGHDVENFRDRCSWLPSLPLRASARRMLDSRLLKAEIPVFQRGPATAIWPKVLRCY